MFLVACFALSMILRVAAKTSFFLLTRPPPLVPATTQNQPRPLKKVSAMVSEAIRKQLMPFVSLEYGSQGEVSLDERLLYVEHYQPYHEVCV